MTDTVTELREIARDLRASLVEHDLVCHELAPVVAGLAKARLVARARHLSDCPKMRLPDLDMWTEMDPDVERLRDKFEALNWHRMALKESMHSLRQILSAFQSTGRIEADLAR